MEASHHESPGREVYRLHTDALIEESLLAGADTANELLLARCARVAEDVRSPMVNKIYDAWGEAMEERKRSGQLRWLDTDSPDSHLMPSATKDIDALRTTLIHHRALQLGAMCMTYIEIPAYNAARALQYNLPTIKRQYAYGPVALVVADNNSTDETAKKVRWMGGNVVPAPVQGIGPARQAARDAILRHTPASPEKTIIVQTDTDCHMSAGYLCAVEHAFEKNDKTLVTVGPSSYRINLSDYSLRYDHRSQGLRTLPADMFIDPDYEAHFANVDAWFFDKDKRASWGDENQIRIVGGQQYRDLTGLKTVRQYFADHGREVDDYLLGSRHPVFIGPNTAYRASLFTDHPVRYPDDKRWEQLYLSIELQRRIDTGEAVSYVESQAMRVSARGLKRYLRNPASEDGPRVHSDPQNGWTPSSTVEASIRAIDREIYGLSGDQYIEAVTTEAEAADLKRSCTRHDDHLIVPARHGSTGIAIAGKSAVIAS